MAEGETVGRGDSGSDALAGLIAAVDEVADTGLVAMRPVELAEWAAEVRRQASRLEAVTAQALACADGAVEGRSAFGVVGCQNAAQVVAIECHEPKRSVQGLARRGWWVTDFPLFAAAWTEGTLTRHHLTELRGLDNGRTRHRLLEAQEYLVAAARDCDWVDFKRVCAYWLLNADPDGDAPADQQRNNRVTYRKGPDGTVTGTFHLDGLAGSVFTTALDTETQRLFQAETHDDLPPRPPARRMADALVNLITRGHEHGDAVTVTPLVNIVMSQDVADNTIARLLDPAIPPLELDGRDVDRRCEFLDGTPLDPRLALVAVAVARFRRVVFDTNNKIIQASAQSRSFPTWMKHLLLIRARGRCRATGCDAPHAWLQADHVHPHSRGGPTNLTNGQMLCGPHNRWKHDHPDCAA